MEAKDVLAVVGTILGGLLAAAAGYLANIGLARFKERSESKAFYRSRLEEAWALVKKVQSESATRYGRVAHTGDGPWLPKEPEFTHAESDQVTMIVMLYFPDVRSSLNAFLAAHSKLVEKCLLSDPLARLATNADEWTKRVVAEITPHYMEANQAYSKLIEQLSSAARSYV